MGLFFNYDKPGPGVEKDAPRKKGAFLFFELLGRNFRKLVLANMLYFAVSLPVSVLYFIISLLFNKKEHTSSFIYNLFIMGLIFIFSFTYKNLYCFITSVLLLFVNQSINKYVFKNNKIVNTTTNQSDYNSINYKQKPICCGNY